MYSRLLIMGLFVEGLSMPGCMDPTNLHSQQINTCVVMGFDTPAGAPLSYTENGMTVTSLHPISAHLHLQGTNLLNHGSCCSTPYQFTSVDGAPFRVLSVDVVSTFGADTMITPDGATVSLHPGTVTFPSPDWDNLSSFLWDSAGNSIIDNLVVCPAVTNKPPIADAGPDQSIECGGSLTAVTLNGSGSSDPDGDALTFTWTGSFGIATGAQPTVLLPLGVNIVTLTVADPSGATATDQVVITIQDTIPPQIAFTLEETTLWPPNHSLRRVAGGVSVTDVCDPSPSISVDVTSNEPINSTGDGNTAPDWVVSPDPAGGLEILLRAERKGNGSGRIYTIAVSGSDTSGNTSNTSGTVTVDHDQGN